MNVRNCRSCGKIFNYLVGPILCPACKDKMEGKFQEVKEYIREHKGVGIAEVSEACDVEASQIRQWLREERLEITEDSAILLNCESCGALIRTGRFCEKCKNDVTRGFKDIVSANHREVQAKQNKNESSRDAKMRFL